MSNSVSHKVRDALIEHAIGTRNIPDSARRAAAIFLEDTVMVGIAGSRLPERHLLTDAARQWSGPGPARLWADGEAHSTATAALINAYQIHCQEFDCVHEPAVVHPMAVIGGALLSWAQANGPIRGRDLLDALVVAVDVATVLGMMATTPMRFFRPAMCGALGASLGLSRLTGLDLDTCQNALGLTYCQLSGNMQSHVEGTSGLALQIGFNARAAVGAHQLSMAGMKGPIDVIDGPFGYLELIEGTYNTAVVEALSHCWQIEQVSHKPFPTGRAAHAALDGLDQLLQAGIAEEDIDQIELHAPPLIRRLIDRPAQRGMSASYARLCLPWLVSVRLARGQIGLDDFSASALSDPERWQRVDCVKVLPDTNANPNALIPQSLSVITRTGHRHQISLPAVLGSPERPLDEVARSAKAQACWRHGGLDDARGQALLMELRQIADRDSLDGLFTLLTPVAGLT